VAACVRRASTSGGAASTLTDSFTAAGPNRRHLIMTRSVNVTFVGVNPSAHRDVVAAGRYSTLNRPRGSLTACDARFVATLRISTVAPATTASLDRTVP
jgi:hypothetical protein